MGCYHKAKITFLTATWYYLTRGLVAMALAKPVLVIRVLKLKESLAQLLEGGEGSHPGEIFLFPSRRRTKPSAQPLPSGARTKAGRGLHHLGLLTFSDLMSSNLTDQAIPGVIFSAYYSG